MKCFINVDSFFCTCFSIINLIAQINTITLINHIVLPLQLGFARLNFYGFCGFQEYCKSFYMNIYFYIQELHIMTLLNTRHRESSSIKTLNWQKFSPANLFTFTVFRTGHSYNIQFSFTQNLRNVAVLEALNSQKPLEPKLCHHECLKCI